MEKTYEVTVTVQIGYDEDKIQEALNEFREVIYDQATLEQLLTHVAAQIARGNHAIEGIGEIYDDVGYNYYKDKKELPPIWWLDIDVDKIEEI